MKTIKKYLLLCLFLIPVWGFAQTSVSGTVTEEGSGLPLPGVNIVVKGTTVGTVSDFDGLYTIEANEGDILQFSYIGYKSQEIPVTGSSLDVVMGEDAEQLAEVVVIGYGTTTKKDATGSVDLVTTEDFNKGAIVSTDQLLNGKAAGVRITNTGGSPDAAPNIRIRGGSSLSAQNNPLIVIDGVPIAQDNPAGVANPLNLINPNDIESFSILKDASATAIYGSRASNGVLIITTKGGSSGEVKFNFSSDVSVSTAGEGLDMMTSAEYVRFANTFLNGQNGTEDITDLLGVPAGSVVTDEPVAQVINGQAIYDTDWRDAVLRTAFTSNTNFSARGTIGEKLPFRASLGYTSAEGVVRTDDYERVTASFKFTPRLLDDNLRIDINGKGIYANKNAIDANGAMQGALRYDPTKPVFDNSPNNRFGGFYTNTRVDGTRLIEDGQRNPLAILEQRTRPEQVYRFLGNVEFDYALPWIEGLSAVVNLGLDYSRANIEEVFSDNAIDTYRFEDGNNDINNNFVFNPGVNYAEEQDITNTTLDAYLKYLKRFDTGLITRIDAQAGYAYQDFVNEGTKDEFIYDDDTGLRVVNFDPLNPENRYFNPLNLQSFFGRANIALADKYLFTFSFRADASSLFTEDNRWGYFPAAAFAWRIKDEAFLQDVTFINDLKLRLGWGETGQQDVTARAGFFPSQPLFQPGGPNSQFLPGVPLFSADPFNPNLTWEKTTTYNAGIDFDLFAKNFISGTFDVYWRETTDLLAEVFVPPGQNFSSSFVDNVGSTESYGGELNLNLNAVQTEVWNLSLNSNLSYNFVEVTDLEDSDNLPDDNDDNNLRGTGASLLYNAVGQQPRSAWVFRQLYDENQNPIPNAFVDRNGDNIINDLDRYHVPIVPNWTYGFGLNANYKNWDLSASFRGQIGGHVYDFNELEFGWIESAVPVNANSPTNVLNFFDGSANPVFQNVIGNIQFSDYYLRDASFLRCDNIALGHRFNNLIKDSSVRFYGAVTNPFIITDYTGQDPENFLGIDRNFYPRPTIYTFGINVDF
ncbi:MAG: TonB-dependent receptor [Bacteroidota bacterium]